MSISALLSTNAEEPNPHPHHPPPLAPPAATTNRAPSNLHVSPTAQRHHVVEKHLQRSPESTRIMPAKQVVNSRPVAAPTYTHTYDADATDSDHEPMYQPPANKKSAAAAAAAGFRDFKYHDSMQLDHNMDATDTDEDSDEFQAERIEYLKNVRKRQLELEEQEVQKRKV
jgi:hypothetical protein